MRNETKRIAGWVCWSLAGLAAGALLAINVAIGAASITPVAKPNVVYPPVVEIVDRIPGGNTEVTQRDLDTAAVKVMMVEKGIVDRPSAVYTKSETKSGEQSFTYDPRSIFDFTFGACDSQQECEDEIDDLCEPHDGVDASTVKITIFSDGSRNCSGDCNSNGAVAFVTCS